MHMVVNNREAGSSFATAKEVMQELARINAPVEFGPIIEYQVVRWRRGWCGRVKNGNSWIMYVVDPTPPVPCGYSEPESEYRDPDTGAHRTARCEGDGRMVVRGTGNDSTTDGEMFISARPCPNCGKH